MFSQVTTPPTKTANGRIRQPGDPRTRARRCGPPALSSSTSSRKALAGVDMPITVRCTPPGARNLRPGPSSAARRPGRSRSGAVPRFSWTGHGAHHPRTTPTTALGRVTGRRVCNPPLAGLDLDPQSNTPRLGPDASDPPTRQARHRNHRRGPLRAGELKGAAQLNPAVRTQLVSAGAMVPGVCLSRPPV